MRQVTDVLPEAPADPEADFRRAQRLHQQGRLDDAAHLYRRLLASRPDHVGALHYLGVSAYQRGDHVEAVRLIESALRLSEATPMACNHLGLALQALGRLPEALASYDRAIAQNPDDALAWNNRGLLHEALRERPAALDDYARAIAIDPRLAAAYNNRGKLLGELQRYAEALVDTDRAIAIQPDNAEAHANRARLLRHLQRGDEAVAAYDRAIALRPVAAEFHLGRGNALMELGRPAEALPSYDRALALRPADADALNNRATALSDMHRHQEALACYDQALAIDPGNALAHANRGSVLQELRRHGEALAAFERALAVHPGLPYLAGSRLFSKMQVCDWEGLDAAFEALLRAVEGGEQACRPLTLLAVPSTPGQQRVCADHYARIEYPAMPDTAPPPAHHAHGRIRIGYFSADFRHHPVAQLIAEVIERHDRTRFEIIAFSFGPVTADPWRLRLERAFDRFYDLGGSTDAGIARRAREADLDIAVDLMGYTHNARTGIFAHRPAPVCVNYLGYPGTLGAAGYMDYILADATVIPMEHEACYAEKIARLPHCFLASDTTKSIDERTPTRREEGLPERGFVFCAFNNARKITPDLFTIWMRLLDGVPGSVLWLSSGDPLAQENLRKEAGRRGVSPDRLVFAQRVESLADHLARHRLADLFLDTFYYNAHTTASDALWAGLPLLTCLGETFAGRVAASLLGAVGLPELVTHSHAEYESLALALAREPERLAGLRRRLAENRGRCPLFDTARFTRHIEAAYAAMHARHRDGLAPDHISIEACQSS